MQCELKYLGPDGFERLIQSLLAGETYGDGPDGQREVVIRDANRLPALPGLTVFGFLMAQVKFKDPNTKTNEWTWLRENLKSELEGFREKAKQNEALKAAGRTDGFYRLPDTWLFFTNQTLTSVLKDGLKDKADAFAAAYLDLIPRIYILGADDVKTMLDNRPMVASAYPALVNDGLRSHQTVRHYAERCFSDHACVDLKQAGDETSRAVDLRDVYTDLSVELVGETRSFSEVIVEMSDSLFQHLEIARDPSNLLYSRRDLLSHALFHHRVTTRFVLLGEAGCGKSTVCRLLCQMFRAAMLRESAAPSKEAQAYAEASEDTEKLPIPQYSRIPVSVPLKDFAAWMNGRKEEACALDLYLCDRINEKVRGNLTGADFHRLLQTEAWLFCFDGLDEVPAASNRRQVIEQLLRFLKMIEEEYGCNQISILTSRPQGCDNPVLLQKFQRADLLPMEPERCMGYLRRLLPYIEREPDEQASKLRVMENALKDPNTAKLLETPLYATILLILARSGGRLPSRRYDLFKQYCETVIRRERQKDLLFDLDGYNWVTHIHRTLGLRLQKESNTSENAAAELTMDRLDEELSSYLTRHGFENDQKRAVAEMKRSITQRLPFLAQTTTGAGAACLLFPLRSIQEYYAAEGILALPDVNQIGTVLKEISRSTYWRNVFLFVADCITGDLDKYMLLNDQLYDICRMNNGDAAYCADEEVAELYKATSLGSRIALDLLHEGIFNRPNDKRRYAALLAPMLLESLDQAGTYYRLLDKLSELPAEILNPLLREIVIPQFEKSYDGDSLGFLLLWKLGSAENVLPEVKEALDRFASQVQIKYSVYYLCSIGHSAGIPSVEDRLLRLFLERRVFWHERNEALLQHLVHLAESRKLKKLPDAAICDLIISFIDPFERRIEKALDHLTPYYDKLAQIEPVLSTQYLKPICTLFSSRGSEDQCFSYAAVPQEDEIPACFPSYLEILRSRGLLNLAGLLELQARPNPPTLQAVWKLWHGGDTQYKAFLEEFLYKGSWYCRMTAKALDGDQTEFEALSQINVDEREKRLRAWIADPVAAIRSGYWEEQIWCRNLPPKLKIEDVLPLLRNYPLSDSLCKLLLELTAKEGQLPQEVVELLLESQSKLEESYVGCSLVFRLFAELPMKDIWNGRFVWPAHVLFHFWIASEDLISSVWDRILRLTGEPESAVWETYSLIPAVPFRERVPLTLPKGCYQHIRATNNNAARLGGILTMLQAPVHPEDQALLVEDLQEFLSDPELLGEFERHYRYFCTECQLELYHLAQKVAPINEEHQKALSSFLIRCVESIRDSLEREPVRLTVLEKNAVSQRGTKYKTPALV